MENIILARQTRLAMIREAHARRMAIIDANSTVTAGRALADARAQRPIIVTECGRLIAWGVL